MCASVIGVASVTVYSEGAVIPRKMYVEQIHHHCFFTIRFFQNLVTTIEPSLLGGRKRWRGFGGMRYGQKIDCLLAQQANTESDLYFSTH